MENFNNIPSTGTFGDVVNKINQNFLLAKEAIDKLAYLDFHALACVGLFASSSALESAVPSPQEGNWALVGTSTPYAVYVADDDGDWNDSGSTFSFNVDFSDYTPRALFDDLTGAVDGIETTLSTLVVNNLTSGGTTKALSAEMGKQLNTTVTAQGTEITSQGTRLTTTENSLKDEKLLTPDVVYQGFCLRNNEIYFQGIESSSQLGNFSLLCYAIGENGQISTGDVLKIYENANRGWNVLPAAWTNRELTSDNRLAQRQSISDFVSGNEFSNGVDFIQIGVAAGASEPEYWTYQGTHDNLVVPAGAKWLLVSKYTTATINIHKHTFGLWFANEKIDALSAKLNQVNQLALNADTPTITNYTFINANLHSESGNINCFWMTRSIGDAVYSATINQSSSEFRCLEPIPVRAGDRIQVNILGGNNGRAWALTDTTRHILSLSDGGADGRTTPLTATATQDGYLLVSMAYGLYAPESGDVVATVRHGVFALMDDTYTKVEVDALVANSSQIAPIPSVTTDVKILVIGNSFSVDALTYLPQLLAVHHPEIALTLCIMVQAGCTISEHYGRLVGDSTLYPSNNKYTTLIYTNNSWGSITSKTINTMLSESWDYILLHQASQYSDNYASRYFTDRDSTVGETDYLQGLIDGVKSHTSQMGWLMTPAYPSGKTSSLGKKQDAMMDGITDFAKNVMDNYSEIKLLLPCGMAVHNARKSTEFTGITNEFFYSDNLHLRNGIACYIETYAAMVALFGDGIKNGYTFNAGELVYYPNTSPYDYRHGTENGITAGNQFAARKCALQAMESPFKKFTTT